MNRCFCTQTYLCRSCRDGIEAAENDPVFDPIAADREADRLWEVRQAYNDRRATR